MLIPKPVRIILPGCLAGAATGCFLAVMKPLVAWDYLMALVLGVVCYGVASFLIDRLDGYVRRMSREPLSERQRKMKS